MKKALFLGWFLVSVAVIGAMYHLFFTREYRQYAGVGIETQRELVVSRAGMPVAVVQAAAAIDTQWPQTARYVSRGDQVRLSYLHYLLAPRVPVAAGEYRLSLENGKVTFSPGGMEKRSGRPDRPNPMALVWSVLLVVGAAFLVRFFFTGSVPVLDSIAVALLGLAIFAVAARFFVGDARPGFIVFAVAGVIGLVLQGWTARRKYPFTGWTRAEQPPPGNRRPHLFPCLPNRPLVWCCLLVIAASVIWAALMAVIVVPDDWDAWAIWGAKAKVLALGSGPLADVTRFGHGDYPLLWPSLWAFSGWLAGGWEEMWSRGWGAVFFLLSCGQLFVMVKDETKDGFTGALAAGLFASVPNVALIASWSYAEAPLWFFSLCALGAALRRRRSAATRDLLLAGIFAAAAAWTKNEGVFFAVLLFVFMCVIEPRSRRHLFVSVLCFVLLYGPWLFWTRGVVGLGDHATAGLNLDAHAVVRAWQRLPAALEAVFRMWRDPRQWSMVGAGIGAAWLYAMVVAAWGRKVELLLPALLLAGFFAIILFHPAEVYWQVGTSWNRLTVQALPLFLAVLVPFFFQRKNGAIITVTKVTL